MSDKYFLLDHFWLLPIVLGGALGAFLVVLKAADTFRRSKTNLSSDSRVEVLENLLNTGPRNPSTR